MVCAGELQALFLHRLLTVTVDPGSRSQLALIDTVMVLTTAAKGVFCSMLLISMKGTSTYRGSDPFTTPSSSAPVFVIDVIATGEMSPNTDFALARTEMGGDACAVEGLVRLKRASYVWRRTIPTLVRVIFPLDSHCPVPSKPDA